MSTIRLTAIRREIDARLDAGQPFEEIEDLIEEMEGLHQDSRSALWLWAWSHLEPSRRWEVVVPAVGLAS